MREVEPTVPLSDGVPLTAVTLYWLVFFGNRKHSNLCKYHLYLEDSQYLDAGNTWNTDDQEVSAILITTLRIIINSWLHASTIQGIQ